MVADIEATGSRISSGLVSLAINWLALGRCDSNSRSVISRHMLWMKFMVISCVIALRWMPLNTSGDNVNIDSGNGLMPSGRANVYGITTPQSVNGFTGPSAAKISIMINRNIFLEIKFQQLTMFRCVGIIYLFSQNVIIFLMPSAFDRLTQAVLSGYGHFQLHQTSMVITRQPSTVLLHASLYWWVGTPRELQVYVVAEAYFTNSGKIKKNHYCMDK